MTTGRTAYALALLTTAASLTPAIAYAQPRDAAAAAPDGTAARDRTGAGARAPRRVTAARADSEEKPEEKPEKPEKPEGADRTLKNHVFLFPAYASTSIVATYLGLRVRFGTQDISNVATAIGAQSISTLSLSEGLDFGLGITDWLGVFVTAGFFRSLIGTNLRALTYAGATSDAGGSGGVIARLFRSERTGSQLSLRGTFGYTQGQVSTLYPIFDQPVLSAAELLQGNLGATITSPSAATARTAGAIAFAQGFGRFFGVQASAGGGGSTVTVEPLDRIRNVRESKSVSDVIYSFAVAPSLDFNAFKVPVAVMPEYVVSGPANAAQIRGAGEFDTVHTAALGVSYSGRVNLQFGLIWATVLGREVSSPRSAARIHRAPTTSTSRCVTYGDASAHLEHVVAPRGHVEVEPRVRSRRPRARSAPRSRSSTSVNVRPASPGKSSVRSTGPARARSSRRRAGGRSPAST